MIRALLVLGIAVTFALVWTGTILLLIWLHDTLHRGGNYLVDWIIRKVDR